MPIVQSRELEEFSADLLEAGGASEAEAAIVARSLVGANLRGHDSHGVMRLRYVAFVREGRMHPVELEVLRRHLGSGLRRGLGLRVQAQRLITRLISKAKATGVGCGT
jgi:uncharacterized oxidoreductase